MPFPHPAGLPVAASSRRAPFPTLTTPPVPLPFPPRPQALKPGGRLLVHDFMVNDSLDSPALGALWALQHVTVNADGLGLCPSEVGDRMTAAGFGQIETQEMIHGLTKLMVAHKK